MITIQSFKLNLLCLNFVVKHILRFIAAKIFICSDYLNSFFALVNMRNFENLWLKIKILLALLKIMIYIDLDFTLMRGHSGICQNEIADILAKHTTCLPFLLNASEPYAKVFSSRKLFRIGTLNACHPEKESR